MVNNTNGGFIFPPFFYCEKFLAVVNFTRYIKKQARQKEKGGGTIKIS